MTNSNDLIWEEPGVTPPSARREWRITLDQLRERPGVWALVATDVATSAANQIKRGRLGGAAPGEFEATLRGIRNGRADKLYARYVGGEQ